MFCTSCWTVRKKLKLGLSLIFRSRCASARSCSGWAMGVGKASIVRGHWNRIIGIQKKNYLSIYSTINLSLFLWVSNYLSKFCKQ